MGLIKKPNELTQSKIKLKGLIYGQPGIGKTSLALSSPKPLLIDFDNGLRRVAKQYQTDSVQIESYQDLIDILEKENISSYETIVIDTLGKVIDRIGDWLSLFNPKIKQSDGQLSMKGWGNVKGEFQRLLKLLENKNKSVIFIAHEKEEKVGDEVMKRPDVAGSSGKDIVKELDFMGYMSMKGGKRTIDLAPNEAYYAKNSLNLNSFLEYLPLTGINNFLTTNIFEAYTNKLAQDELLIIEYDNVITELQNKINNLKNAEDLNLYYSSIYNKHDKLWSSYQMEANFLKIKTEELGCEFDKKSKKFVSNKEEEIKVEEVKKEEVKND
jgi:phage nucleotide-binding protein